MRFLSTNATSVINLALYSACARHPPQPRMFTSTMHYLLPSLLLRPSNYWVRYSNIIVLPPAWYPDVFLLALMSITHFTIQPYSMVILAIDTAQVVRLLPLVWSAPPQILRLRTLLRTMTGNVSARDVFYPVIIYSRHAGHALVVQV